jgi:hypothetical protein
MVGTDHLAACDGVNIDRHRLDCLAGVAHPHELAARRAAGLAADDRSIAGDQHFLDLPLQIRNGLVQAGDAADDLVARAAGVVAAARDPVRRCGLHDERSNLIASRCIEGAVERRDGRARLPLREWISSVRRSGNERQAT